MIGYGDADVYIISETWISHFFANDFCMSDKPLTAARVLSLPSTGKSMAADYIALAAILTVALVLFWTQWIRTDLTALLVTVALICRGPTIMAPGTEF